MDFDNHVLALAHQLADAAGDILRRHWQSELAVDTKADASPVTLADRECETVMRALIEKAFPEHGIIGEEHGNVRSESIFQWVLDPIDGTRAFIAGQPTFTTLIALTKHKVPVLGIIDQPIHKERWIGIVGQPTTYNGNPIAARGANGLSHASISTTSTSYFKPNEAKAFDRLKDICASVSLGGDAYAYAMLASGKQDLVVDAGMKTYDFCALRPVVEGAGGVITDWHGKPLSLETKGDVVAAATPALHADALTLIRPQVA